MKPEMTTYRVYGYACQLPRDVEFQGIEMHRSGYAIQTPGKILQVKACHKCKRLLELDAFYERKSPCKACHIAMVTDWQKRNPDRVKAHKRVCNKNYRYKQKLRDAGLE